MKDDNKNQPNEPIEPELEVLAPNVIQSLERAQIDTQVATAHHYPRSIERFRKQALSLVTSDEETAESCIYSRPVGKEQNDRGQWVEKFAEGASIRMAEIVASCFGNLRVESRIIEQTDRFVRCAGTAWDLENNNAQKSEVIESTVKKDGTPYSERQRALVAKVCLAKAHRDAVFKVVPKALCKSAYDAAKNVIKGTGKTIEERQKRVRAWLTSIKIDDARVFTALGVAGWAEVGEDQLLTLTGLKTSIADGDVKVDEAFPPIPKKPAESGPAEQPTDPATVAANAAAIEAQAKLLEKPYETIVEFCKRDSVTLDQVFEVAKAKKMTSASQVELNQLSDAKLRDIVKTWGEWLPKIKAAVVA